MIFWTALFHASNEGSKRFKKQQNALHGVKRMKKHHKICEEPLLFAEMIFQARPGELASNN